VAANSKKQIRGVKGDKIVINPRRSLAGSSRDPYEGEVILCFEIDDPRDKEKRVCRSLGIQESDKKCDGIIFYSQDDWEHRVICLVEMKSTQIKTVAEQIISTRNHVKELLREECGEHCSKQLQRIEWKACFYCHEVSQDEVVSIQRQLRSSGFDSVALFTTNDFDAGPFLRGEENTRELARRNRRKR
ncbi:MAG: hypothetical protein ABI406_20525, partial [Ktedonobacteraceae bacterium]